LVKSKKRTLTIAGERVATAGLTAADDLTRIHGIGPKIRDLLHENGIFNFLQLAHRNPREIKTILESGGENFRISSFTNPETWAEQAQLLHDDKLTAFSALKESLGWSGGSKNG
jgi:large subunit ribosomal protein L17